MTIDPKRLAKITTAAEDGINCYNTLSSATYCGMLSELLAERAELKSGHDRWADKTMLKQDQLLGYQQFQANLWGLLCPDARPDDKQAIIDSVEALLAREAEAIKVIKEHETVSRGLGETTAV